MKLIELQESFVEDYIAGEIGSDIMTAYARDPHTGFTKPIQIIDELSSVVGNKYIEPVARWYANGDIQIHAISYVTQLISKFEELSGKLTHNDIAMYASLTDLEWDLEEYQDNME